MQLLLLLPPPTLVLLLRPVACAASCCYFVFSLQHVGGAGGQGCTAPLFATAAVDSWVHKSEYAFHLINISHPLLRPRLPRWL